MHKVSRNKAVRIFNQCGKEGKPFFFLTPYDPNQKTLYTLLDRNAADDLAFKFPEFEFGDYSDVDAPPLTLEAHLPSFEQFENDVLECKKELAYGNTYLMNLTYSVPITLNWKLKQVYRKSSALYKCLVKDQFTFFSPERFIRIQDEKISTHPMKGTIDATIENAEEILRSDPKEKAEHYTVVDLLRNDLSMVSENVKVQKFAYIDRLETHKGPILQMSSEIEGTLPFLFEENLGDILFRLMPAGSITGAPKKKTVEIINRIESHQRGYYTGIAGYYDGRTLDSCVAIRFIKKEGEMLYFKAGMGLTWQSDIKKEYAELEQKIYIPTL